MFEKDHDNTRNHNGPQNFDNENLLNELRKSEANHRLIFQKSALPQLICTQKDLRIVKVNEAALELYEYMEDEFLQLDIRQLRLPADRGALDAKVYEALRLRQAPKIHSDARYETWPASDH